MVGLIVAHTNEANINVCRGMIGCPDTETKILMGFTDVVMVLVLSVVWKKQYEIWKRGHVKREIKLTPYCSL